MEMSNVIDEVFINPEIENAWEIMWDQLSSHKEALQEIFPHGPIPSRKASVMPDGGLQLYVLGKGGKIIMNIPPEAWMYKTLH